jgi:hypothetical protein
MQKAECRFFTFWQCRPVATHRFEQLVGAHDVGLDEVAWAADGTIHMALGRKIDYCARLVLGQKVIHQPFITNITLQKSVAWVSLQARQGLQITRISELIEVDHGLV